MKKNRRFYVPSVILLASALAAVMGFGMFAATDEAEATTHTFPNWHPGHYLLAQENASLTISGGDYDSLLRETASDGTLLFRGIQQKYDWKDLEPTKDNYDFSQISDDLSHLQNMTDANGNSLHLKLVVQIQTKAFGQNATATPSYIAGSYYGGGVYQASSGSYDPVRWNDHVRTRLKALYAELGASYNNDPTLETVVLSETAPSASVANINSQSISPSFTYQAYADAISDEIASVKTAFPNTITIQYTNFPYQSFSDIPGVIASGTGIIDAERSNGVGLGGPDIKIWQNTGDSLIGTNSAPSVYPFYGNYWGFSNVNGLELTGVVPLGTAVQYADYFADANNTIPADISDIYDYGKNKLNLNYIYWLDKADRIQDVIDFLKTKVSSSDPTGGLVRPRPTCCN
jgi:hypothetical protein